MYEIIIVEDEPYLRESLNFFLTSRGNKCTEAANGIEALELMDTERFDAVITDISMPKMNGVAMLHEFARRGFSVPVMIMTGGQTIRSREEAFRAGARGFIYKPFALQDFIEEFYRMMDKHCILTSVSAR